MESTFDKNWAKRTKEKDGLRFYVYIKRLSEYLNEEKENLMKFFPANTKEYEPWLGAHEALAGYFKIDDEIKNIIRKVEISKEINLDIPSILVL